MKDEEEEEEKNVIVLVPFAFNLFPFSIDVENIYCLISSCFTKNLLEKFFVLPDLHIGRNTLLTCIHSAERRKIKYFLMILTFVYMYGHLYCILLRIR